MTTHTPILTASLRRRQFLASIGGAVATAGALHTMPAWARGETLTHGGIRKGFDQVSGASIDLAIGEGQFGTGGRMGHAIAVNGSVPGPLVRLREGQDVRINVTNTLATDSSIHWHGILVPFQFDGVPGVSFPGIKPGETFTAAFKVRQNGTYWWHSHSGLQEQAGHYGPIVIDPAGPDPYAADRDYVVLLSEFTPMHPHKIMDKLKKGNAYFNYQKTTLTDDYPLSAKDRLMWGKMRMMPTDILDISGSAYTYLLNGHGPDDNLELMFRPGERVRLRFINGSAMSFFNIRIPGLAMTVVAADGQNIRPVEIDEFQIGTAETYDVIVEPKREQAFAIVAEAMDRSGMGVAMLTPAKGMRADVPALREPILLTMADMGMNGGGHGGMDMGSTPAADPAMPGMDHKAMGHASPSPAMPDMAPDKADTMAGMAMGSMAGMNMRDTSLLPPQVKVGPGIDMVAMNPIDRTGDPGLGLDKVDHRVLNYRQLSALEANADLRTPSRAMEIHLTGNMERFMWSFDGKKFAAVSDHPIRFAYNERVRVKLINDTMMVHPIHLHGHFFEVVNGQDTAHQPRKHTVNVQPGGSISFDLTANEPGDWAFHCHLLFHMHAGMFQIVTVASPTGAGA
mgnify:CR=1 FL=1